MAGGKSTNCICRFIAGNIIEPIKFGIFSHPCLITAGYIMVYIYLLRCFWTYLTLKLGCLQYILGLSCWCITTTLLFPELKGTIAETRLMFLSINVSTAEETPVMKTKYQKICRKQVSTVSISLSIDIVLNIHKTV